MQQLIPYRIKDKWGFSTIDREIVIDCIFDKVKRFSENGKTQVVLKGKEKYINEKGEILSINDLIIDPAKYIYWDPFNDKPSPYEYKYVYFDRETHRNLIPSNKPKNYNEKYLAPIQRDSDSNGMYGYVNSNGELILPFIYNNADFFYEGLALVSTKEGKGFINEVGEFVIGPSWDTDFGRFSEGLTYLVSEGGFIGFINKNGDLVIKLNMVQPSDFSEGLAAVRTDKWGYINKSGKFIVPPVHDQLYDFSEGMGKVRMNNRYGFFGKFGILMIPIIYEEAEIFSNGIAKVKYNGKWGYIDKIGLPYWED